MGLIRLAAAVLGAGAASLNTTLGNSWIDYFESGDMSGGVIQRRAQRIVGPRSKNKNSDENNKFRSNCATLTVGYKFSL